MWEYSTKLNYTIELKIVNHTNQIALLQCMKSEDTKYVCCWTSQMENMNQASLDVVPHGQSNAMLELGQCVCEGQECLTWTYNLDIGRKFL